MSIYCNDGPSVAHIEFASTHYSLAKRYMEAWWQKPLAVWHLWRAAFHVNRADEKVLNFSNMSVDQIDVVTTIWRRVPAWLGGSITKARRAIKAALSPNHPEARSMKPHTRALLHISLGEIEWRMGDVLESRGHYDQAIQLVSAIKEEDSSDREQQLVRVMSAVGFFYLDHNVSSTDGLRIIRNALDLARRASKDQTEKILGECRKRGLRLA